jgi:hypothetical protein
MEENEDKKKKIRICKRCKKNTAIDLLCTACKVDLLNLYDSKIDWQTAYEIEKIQRIALRYIDNDYLE